MVGFLSLLILIVIILVLKNLDLIGEELEKGFKRKHKVHFYINPKEESYYNLVEFDFIPFVGMQYIIELENADKRYITALITAVAYADSADSFLIYSTTDEEDKKFLHYILKDTDWKIEKPKDITLH